MYKYTQDVALQMCISLTHDICLTCSAL